MEPLAIFDADLLVYENTYSEDIEARLAVLEGHINYINAHEAKSRISLSEELEAMIYEGIPWSSSKDLSNRLSILFQRISFIPPKSMTVPFEDVTFRPEQAVCTKVKDSQILKEWKRLLGRCVIQAEREVSRCLVATWRKQGEADQELSVKVTGSERVEGVLPLVFDEHGWNSQYHFMEWWPDLHKCVRCCFETDNAMRKYRARLRNPLSFDTVPSFERDIKHYCTQEARQRALVVSLTKKVHGIKDRGLKDERVKGSKNLRRLTVIKEEGGYRLHYMPSDGKITLVNFSDHDNMDRKT
jgi:hypothetical protein